MRQIMITERSDDVFQTLTSSELCLDFNHALLPQPSFDRLFESLCEKDSQSLTTRIAILSELFNAVIRLRGQFRPILDGSQSGADRSRLHLY